MLIRCLSCSAEITVDDMFIETVRCPHCGSQFNLGERHTIAVGEEAPAHDTNARLEGRQTEVMPRDPANSPNLQPSAAPFPWTWGRFIILGRLGNGGFGTVYRARDEHLRREVALKIPRIEKIRDVERLTEMLAEARKLAGLSDPGIVTVFDVGVLPEAVAYVPLDQVDDPEIRARLEQGIPFIAMRLLEGNSLQERIKSRAFEPREAARVVQQLAQAMGHAHQKGLVHRDLKPNNILVDAQDQPTIIDFGLAVEEEGQLNLSQQAAGTLEYMSPEQLLGQAYWLDARCDIWALGVILYELLTGKRPYRGTREQIRDQILYREPKPPRQTNPEIPSELETICLKCLSKDVKGRYNTAKDLASVLRESICFADARVQANATDTSKSISAFADAQALPEVGQLKQCQKRPKLWVVAGLGGVLIFLTLTLLPRQREIGPWRNLLARVPVMELKSTLLPTDVVYFDARSGRLILGNQHPALCILDELTSDNVTIRMSFSKQTWSGWTGILLVGRRDFRQSEQPSMEFEAVGIHSFQPAGQLRQHRIERKRFRASSSPPQYNPMIDEEVLVSSADVEIPFASDADLELQFRGGRLVEVRWMGVRYPSLEDNNPQNSLLTSGCRGMVGIVHMEGDVNVAEFKIHVADALPSSDAFMETVR